MIIFKHLTTIELLQQILHIIPNEIIEIIANYIYKYLIPLKLPKFIVANENDNIYNYMDNYGRLKNNIIIIPLRKDCKTTLPVFIKNRVLQYAIIIDVLIIQYMILKILEYSY